MVDSDIQLEMPPWQEPVDTPTPSRGPRAHTAPGWMATAGLPKVGGEVSSGGGGLSDSSRHCCIPNTDLGFLRHLLRSPRQSLLGLMPNPSVSSCADVCTCPSLCPCVPANVAANLKNLPSSPVGGRCGPSVQRGWSSGFHHPPVWDMDLVECNNLDGQRLEVVADGVTLWHGAQLAIDTTLVSPLCRDGSARPRAADHDGAALDDARRRKGAHFSRIVWGRGKGSPGDPGCGGWRQVERRDCQLLGLSGEGEGIGFLPIVLQGRVQQACLRSQVERSSGLFSSARVLCFFAGPPPSGGSWGYPFSA